MISSKLRTDSLSTYKWIKPLQRSFLLYYNPMECRGVTAYIRMMHGAAAAQLIPLTEESADSLCQELIKQQGNKTQAPKPSLEGRVTAWQAVLPSQNPVSSTDTQGSLPTPAVTAGIPLMMPVVGVLDYACQILQQNLPYKSVASLENPLCSAQALQKELAFLQQVLKGCLACKRPYIMAMCLKDLQECTEATDTCLQWLS